MICNCDNKDGNKLTQPKVKHVFGNVLRLAIPLTLRTIEVVDGEAVATDTDFIPSSDYPVVVTFGKGAVNYSLDAEMRDGNVAFVEDKGKLPVGIYNITVTCNDDNGNPYRFKQRSMLQVFDATDSAGIEPPIEYVVATWYLDAALFLALKGEDGVGIVDIVTKSSDEIGGLNTVTFILSNGETRSFTVMNGSGTVDNEFNINSGHPIANRVVASKFSQVDASLSDLFGDVDYDTQNKAIRFWDKGKTKILATLDSRPFIKDGMVNNVYISNNTLVITFNTDSGREAIGVPLSSVFNPNNYYTKSQVDNKVNTLQMYLEAMMPQETYIGGDQKLKGQYAAQVVLYAMGEEYDEGDTTPVPNGYPIFENGYIKMIGSGYQSIILGVPQSHLIYANVKTKKLYLWNGRRFVETAGGASGGGMEVSYANGVLTFSGTNQPTYNNGILTI